MYPLHFKLKNSISLIARIRDGAVAQLKRLPVLLGDSRSVVAKARFDDESANDQFIIDEMPENSPRRKANRANVKGTRCFVANLPYEATWQDLKDHFKTVPHALPSSLQFDVTKSCII